jgi:hypothetical protein
MLNKLLKNLRISSLNKMSTTNSLYRSIPTRSNLIRMNKFHFTTKTETAVEIQEQPQEEQPEIQINCKNFQ